MDTLDTPQAKLLFIVGDLFKKQMINTTERSGLKDMIMGEYEPLYHLVEVYTTTAQQPQLMSEILTLIREEQPEQPTPLEADSPLDSKIMKKRRQRNQIKEVREQLTLKLNQ